MERKFKEGDILRGKVNGRKFEILEDKEKGYYRYKDLQNKKVFITNYETLERCAVEKVEGERNEKKRLVIKRSNRNHNRIMAERQSGGVDWIIKKTVCWDKPCSMGFPICCFDCEAFIGCPEACENLKCRGEVDD